MSLSILCLFLGIGEIIVRQNLVQSYLNTPSLLGRHRHFERQWNRLEKLVKSGVEIQCIALGNSMILNSFDPHIFSNYFSKQSDQDIRCFNFGVDALTPVSANTLAQILIETYRPELIIFGTDARDFAIDRDSEETSIINDTAWIKYRQGDFNLEGWIIDHSYLYRYRHSLAELFLLSINRTEEPVANQYGFEPYDIVFPATLPPDPNDSSYHIQYYYQILENYAVKPENEKALSQIVALHKTGTTVVVVEMPIPDGYFHFFDNPVEDYNLFIEALQKTTDEYHVLLLETTRLHLIPDDGWMDYSHVNMKGAEIFSEWLGAQIGKAVTDGSLMIFSP